MKFIQVTTVQKNANVEVIELFSSFIAKSVRAGDAAEDALRALDEDAPVCPLIDEHGLEVVDETGKALMQTDWDEWKRRGYADHRLLYHGQRIDR